MQACQLLCSAKDLLHQVHHGTVRFAHFEHARLEEVSHGLGHVDLDAAQYVQCGHGVRGVEVDHLVDVLLRDTCGKQCNAYVVSK